MNRYIRPVISVFLIFSSCCLLAQDTARPRYTDIRKIILAEQLNFRDFELAYIDPHTSLAAAYDSLSFQRKTRKSFIPISYVTKKTVLRFRICNTADSAMAAWFFPGIYFREIRLYRVGEDSLQKIPSVRAEKPDGIAYRHLSLLPHDSLTIVAELSAVKTYLNRVEPQLINSRYLSEFITAFHASNSQANTITYIFCGLLLMMILYSLSNFFQDGNPEFLYYSGYAFFLGLMLLVKAIYTFRTTGISFFQEEYLDFVMQSAGHLFYMVFMQRYLSTKTWHPFLHKLYNAGIVILVLSVLAFTYLYFFTDNFPAQNSVENITKIVLLVMVTVFLAYSILRRKDKLLRYLFWGNLCLFAFSFISQAMVMSSQLANALPGILRSSLLYYETGLFLELVFFLAGLNYKNRKQLMLQAGERERLKSENQMKEYEKELAVFKAQQEERERISADMHDELGSGMTAIRLMSEIARNKMKEDTPVEIEKISHSADEVLNKMNAIIWSMNSDNDTLDSLILYIRSYALEYFESTPINCKINIPAALDGREVTGDKRRNIFLCVKETLNNALKHSRASEINISIRTEDELEIAIADNGVGIDLERIRQFGNGLKNIAKRMENIGGRYRIENRNGTVTTFTLPL